ncbi:MAG: hypothetical protein WD512_17555 [Candidatus Paceibacterota bacterium]
MTLSDLEICSFPINEKELSQMILQEELKLNQALQNFENKKRALLAKNPGPVVSWSEESQKKWLSEIAKIDAITEETINYIIRLLAEVTQITD